MMPRPLLASLAVALVAAACGGSSSPASSEIPAAGQTVVVTTAPPDVDLEPGQTVALTAKVTGTADTSVTWSVAEADGGTVDANGVYTAPAIEGTFHVQAVSATSLKSAGTSVVKVKKNPPRTSTVAVALSPSSITLDACRAQVFTATVSNASNGAVTWTVVEGSAGGTVAGNGIYTAPQAAGTYHVVATSVADPTRTATGTIVVGPEKVVSVAVTPATGATVATSGRQAFAAAVTTTCGTFPAN